MNILVQPYTHTLSHISRPLLVAKELRNRGHNLLFAGESSKTKFIREEGFDVLSLFEPNPEILFGNIRAGRLKFINDATIDRMIEADLALYRSIKPDLVLTDGRFSAPISTHIAGIRHAAIVNVSSTEYRALPYIPFFDGIPGWAISRNSHLWKMLEVFNLKLEMVVFDNAMNIFKKLSRKYRLAKTITATNCLTGKDLTLLADIPEYFPTRNLPDNYRYVGPLTWETASPPPSWWPPRKSGSPLIYITMGTTGIGDFFHTVYELLRTSNISAIITTGAQASGLESIDGKVYIEKYIDGDLAMKECDMVICHGGNGTIYQALKQGKPIIGIPTIPDQKFNMRRVEALGVGRTLPWEVFGKNPAALVELIMTIRTHDSFYQNASRLKDMLHSYDAPALAADTIEACQGTL